MTKAHDHQPTAKTNLSDAEIARIAVVLRKRLQGDLATARKWFWAAVGTALAAGIAQLVSLLIARHFR